MSKFYLIKIRNCFYSAVEYFTYSYHFYSFETCMLDNWTLAGSLIFLNVLTIRLDRLSISISVLICSNLAGYLILNANQTVTKNPLQFDEKFKGFDYELLFHTFEFGGKFDFVCVKKILKIHQKIHFVTWRSVSK